MSSLTVPGRIITYGDYKLKQNLINTHCHFSFYIVTEENVPPQNLSSYKAAKRLKHDVPF